MVVDKSTSAILNIDTADLSLENNVEHSGYVYKGMSLVNADGSAEALVITNKTNTKPQCLIIRSPENQIDYILSFHSEVFQYLKAFHQYHQYHDLLYKHLMKLGH